MDYKSEGRQHKPPQEGWLYCISTLMCSCWTRTFWTSTRWEAILPVPGSYTRWLLLPRTCINGFYWRHQSLDSQWKKNVSSVIKTHCWVNFPMTKDFFFLLIHGVWGHHRFTYWLLKSPLSLLHRDSHQPQLYSLDSDTTPDKKWERDS